MKARGIIQNADQVRALLDGRRTQLRVPVPAWQLPKKTLDGSEYISIAQRDRRYGFGVFGTTEAECMDNYSNGYGSCCPYGQPGDLLYVRESFLPGLEYDENGMPTERDRIFYRATDYDMRWYDGDSDFPQEVAPWKSSTQMPRRASRLTLRITSVRVERVQDISESDAQAEGAGIPLMGHDDDFCRGVFRENWESINGASRWNANPWVWVIEYEVIHANVDTVIKEAA